MSRWKSGGKAGVFGGRGRGCSFNVELKLAPLESQPVVIRGSVWVKEGGLALPEDFGACLKHCGEHVLDWFVKFNISRGSMLP